MTDQQSHVITIQAEPQPILVDLARSAVLVVDMQNAFAHKGGYFDLVGLDITPIQRIIEPCREDHQCCPRHRHQDHLSPDGMQSRSLRQGVTRCTQFDQIQGVVYDEGAP